MLSCRSAAVSCAADPTCSSSPVPVTLAIDHSRPSALLEANQESVPPASRAAMARPARPA